MGYRLENLVAELGAPLVPDESENIRRYRLTTQAIVEDYLRDVQVLRQKWLVKQVQAHLAELHENKRAYFQRQWREIGEAFRHSLKDISVTGQWWATWRPFWLASRTFAVYLTMWLVASVAPMTNGAGTALQTRCVKRFLLLQASP